MDEDSGLPRAAPPTKELERLEQEAKELEALASVYRRQAKEKRARIAELRSGAAAEAGEGAAGAPAAVAAEGANQRSLRSRVEALQKAVAGLRVRYGVCTGKEHQAHAGEPRKPKLPKGTDTKTLRKARNAYYSELLNWLAAERDEMTVAIRAAEDKKRVSFA